MSAPRDRAKESLTQTALPLAKIDSPVVEDAALLQRKRWPVSGRGGWLTRMSGEPARGAFSIDRVSRNRHRLELPISRTRYRRSRMIESSHPQQSPTFARGLVQGQSTERSAVAGRAETCRT
jgi:hypothetical protein